MFNNGAPGAGGMKLFSKKKRVSWAKMISAKRGSILIADVDCGVRGQMLTTDIKHFLRAPAQFRTESQAQDLTRFIFAFHIC